MTMSSFFAERCSLQMMAGVADRRAHAGGQLAGHAGEPGLRRLVPVLVEVLEAVVLDVVAAVRAEAVDGERVADLVDRVGQQHAGLLGEFAHRVFLVLHLLVGGFGQVEQHQDREVARLAHAAHHDARVGLVAEADVDEAGDRRVDVDLVAVLQLADALHALRLHRVEQELHAVDLALVLGGDVVDDLQVAGLGALFQHRGPGRTLQLDLVVPLGIVEGVGHRLLAFQLVEACRRSRRRCPRRETARCPAPRFPRHRRRRSRRRPRWPSPSR